MTDLYTPVFYTWCVRTFGNYTHLFWTVLEYLGCLHPRFSKPVGKNQCKEAREFWMCWVGSDFRQLEIYGNIYFGGSVTKVSDFIRPFLSKFYFETPKIIHWSQQLFSFHQPSQYLINGNSSSPRSVYLLLCKKSVKFARQVCWFFQKRGVKGIDYLAASLGASGLGSCIVCEIRLQTWPFWYG